MNDKDKHEVVFEPRLCEFVKGTDGFTEERKRLDWLIYEIATGFCRGGPEVAFYLLEIAILLYKGAITPYWLCLRLTRCYRTVSGIEHKENADD